MDRPFLIRDAVISDAASLADFAARQFRETYSADTPAADMESYVARNFSVERQGEEITRSDSHLLLATFGDAIIGYAHVHLVAGDAGSAYLNRIYVDPSWKGKAVGSALLSEILQKARGLGANRIELSVYQKNTRAVAFYTKAGFAVTRDQVFIIGDDEQIDFIMEKRLV